MTRYAEGQPVIVTTEEKHQVGVIVNVFKVKKKTFYDILLESRSAISTVNSSSNNKTYINRELTKQLCDSGAITPTIDYNHLVEEDLIPHTRA